MTSSRSGVRPLGAASAAPFWGVLRRRKVAHWVTVHSDDRVSTACGQSRGRYLSAVREGAAGTRRCEQCEIALVTGVRGALFKFFVDHVPADVRNHRRNLWRAHLGLSIEIKPNPRRLRRAYRRALRAKETS